jgi:hypothetical protein
MMVNAVETRTRADRLMVDNVAINQLSDEHRKVVEKASADRAAATQTLLEGLRERCGTWWHADITYRLGLDNQTVVRVWPHKSYNQINPREATLIEMDARDAALRAEARPVIKMEAHAHPKPKRA